MTSRLETIFNEFVTVLGANVDTHPLYQRCRFGRKHVHELKDIPKLIFYPISGEIKDPDQVGGGKASVGDTEIRSRIIRRHLITCELYLNAADLETTENMLHNSVQAFQSFLGDGGAVSFGRTRFAAQEDGTQNFRGECVIAEVVIDFSMYDVQCPLTTMTGWTDEDVWGHGEGESVPCKPPEPEP
jgi:hypothetical protein